MAAVFHSFFGSGSSGWAAVWHGFALAAALTAGPALGQSSSWNVDADGNWTVGSNWLSGSNAAGNGNTGTFANDITATRTVTLDANRALGTVIFGDADPSSAASWIIAQGGTSTLSMNNNTSVGQTNDATITVNALGTGATATISAPLGANVVNTPTIIKDGVGTLVLSNAANAFTANLAITAGTLQVSADRNLGGTGTGFTADRITISNGATLGTTASFAMNANRGITIGTGGGTLNITGGALTYPARFTGPGQTLTTAGTAGLVLTNTTGTASNVNWDLTGGGTRIFYDSTNALGTGDVQIRGGVRLVSQSNPIGSTVTNAITVDDGGGISARNSGGAVEYSNVSFPSTGTIVLNKDDQVTSPLTISSGQELTGNLTVDTSQQAANAVGDVTLSGVFSGASGAIIKAGTGDSGKLILGGVNTYGGNTTINTGTLALGASGSIANSLAIVVASGATFDVSAVTGGFTLGAAQALNGVGTVAGNVTADGTLSPGLAGGAGTLSFGNNLSLGSGSILNFGLNGGDSTVGGGVNDLIDLTAGNLTLDGTINVTASPGGSFSSVTSGSWRLFSYAGSLTDNALSLGTMPSLPSGFQFGIDTTTANQVNLVVSAVPEPGTIVTALVGLGLCGGVAVARRRARRNF